MQNRTTVGYLSWPRRVARTTTGGRALRPWALLLPMVLLAAGRCCGTPMPVRSIPRLVDVASRIVYGRVVDVDLAGEGILVARKQEGLLFRPVSLNALGRPPSPEVPDLRVFQVGIYHWRVQVAATLKGTVTPPRTTLEVEFYLPTHPDPAP
ncbi:MAG: hypothetical protein HY321_04865 [Armatimonadetes bacterium]|nr:hypothetical protein [Armatimonadota bacterium]